MIPHLNLETGVFTGQEPQSRRTLGELAAMFRNPDVVSQTNSKQTVVYEVCGCPGEVEGPAVLLYATTVLQPGQVDGEYFMTRGHFHKKPERGELVFTLRGRGALILMNRERETWMEPMDKGSVHDIDGRFAHRVANTGEEPLVFLVAWMSDCGHDYESILKDGFGSVLVAGENGPQLMGKTV